MHVSSPIGSIAKASLGAAIACLHRRTWHGAVRTEHAAIALPGLQPFPTIFAIVEELAGIGRHRLGCPMAAMRTSERRFQPHQRCARTILNPVYSQPR